MPDDDPNDDPNSGGGNQGGGSGNSAANDVAALRRQLSDAQARIRDVNAESRGHRLQADNFKQEAADLRTRLDTAIATHNTVLEAAKTQADAALEALRAELSGQLETTRTELTGKMTETEAKAAEIAAKAKTRAQMADLKVAAKDAGMVDLDGLKLLPSDQLKLNDDGDVTNAAELMAALKEAKPYLFGNPGTTSSTSTPPPANSTEKKRATEMTDEEYRSARSQIKMTGRVPA